MTVINVYAVVDADTDEVIARHLTHEYTVKCNGLTLTYQDLRTLKITHHNVFLSKAQKYVDKANAIPGPHCWISKFEPDPFISGEKVTDFSFNNYHTFSDHEKLSIYLD